MPKKLKDYVLEEGILGRSFQTPHKSGYTQRYTIIGGGYGSNSHYEPFKLSLIHLNSGKIDLFLEPILMRMEDMEIKLTDSELRKLHQSLDNAILNDYINQHQLTKIKFILEKQSSQTSPKCTSMIRAITQLAIEEAQKFQHAQSLEPSGKQDPYLM